MLNRVTLIGRLTRNPESRTTATGKSVCTFGIAVNRRTKQEDGDADFFTVSCWNQTADYVSNYLTKGTLVAVDGRLSWRKYVTSDGQNREVIEVVADSVQGLDKRDANNQGSASSSDGEYDPFEDN